MTGATLLKWSNISMVVFLIAFAAALYGAWGLETELPIMALTLLHVAQIVTAGLFKLAYVLRLVAQSQLGQSLR